MPGTTMSAAIPFKWKLFGSPPTALLCSGVLYPEVMMIGLPSKSRMTCSRLASCVRLSRIQGAGVPEPACRNSFNEKFGVNCIFRPFPTSAVPRPGPACLTQCSCRLRCKAWSLLRYFQQSRPAHLFCRCAILPDVFSIQQHASYGRSSLLPA